MESTQASRFMPLHRIRLDPGGGLLRGMQYCSLQSSELLKPSQRPLASAAPAAAVRWTRSCEAIVAAAPPARARVVAAESVSVATRCSRSGSGRSR